MIAADGEPARIVFSGVGKKPQEMARALELGIHCFNLESAAELEVLNRVAADGVVAPVSVRSIPTSTQKPIPISPPVCARTSSASPPTKPCGVYRRATELSHIEVVGLDCHIGSQLTQLSPFLDALHCLLALVDTLAAQGITIRHLDLGAAWVRYRDETPPSIGDYIAAIRLELGDRKLKLMFEPAAPSPPMPACW